MPDYEPNMVLSTGEYRVVGTRPIRHDGPDKVTGRARYAADVHPPGLLHGKILRSPHAHARIKSIDTSGAMALPGVKAVMTAADLPDISALVPEGEGVMVNYGFYSRNVMAREKALYRGHAVAAVAATSPHTAEEALSRIKVDYEVLRPVLTADEAMKDGAPILHERLVTRSVAGPGPGGYSADAPEKPSNIATKFVLGSGDVEAGFAEADLVLEREFHTKAVHQGYIEPHSATSMWSTDGSVTVWTSTQQIFGHRDHISSILGLPVSKVKLIPMEIGGGFGGKGLGGVYVEPVAAILSQKTGAPVKVTMTRTEVFLGTGPTSASHLQVKLGVTKEGRITAGQARIVFEAGAFPGSPVAAAARTMFSPYNIPNLLVEGLDVVVNTQKVAAYRAPGAPAGALAVEGIVDELCEKLGIDPIEFRQLNASKEGTRQIGDVPFGRIGNVEMLEAAKDHPHYRTPLGGPHRGRGVASGFWFNASGPASAVASVNADGTISLVEGAPDIGGSRVAMAMQVAEALGLAVHDVRPSVADSDSIGYSSGAGGSSVTFKMGKVCYEAAQDIKQQMIARAALKWQASADDVEYHDGVLRHKTDAKLQMTFKEMAGMLNATGGPVVGRATAMPPGVGNAFALHIIDVEVDPDTGKVEVLRYTAIQDSGKAVHPSYVEGQMQGGASQGIGWALNEEYNINDEGEMVNSSFLDYRMPTALDLPMIDTVIVEVPNPGHPYGVRGVGEVCLVPSLAAVANAVSHAIGVRMTDLPMTPARVLEALWEKGARSNGG